MTETEHARLQREAQRVAMAPGGPDVLQVFFAQGVVGPANPTCVAEGKTEPSAAGMAGRIAAPFSFARRMQDIDSDMG